MVEILTFSSGDKVILIDGKMYLTYGKQFHGVFLVAFEDIFKNLYLNEDTFMNITSEDNGCITIKRIKDYDGEVLMLVDKIPDNRKVGNIYTKTFDAYESMIIKAIAVSLSS